MSVQPARRWQPYPAYKDSGVAWLGEIPVHWEIKRLKYATSINSDVLKEDTDPNYIIQYLDISNVDSNGSVLELQEMPFENAPSRARRRVNHGDTVISTVRTYLRAITYMDQPPENLIASTGFAILCPNAEIYPQYLWRLVQSQEFVERVVANSVGIGYPAINPSTLGSLKIWLPPLSEQHAIAAFLDRETAKLDALIAAKQRLIALLHEQRSALISHAVTKGLDPSVPMRDSGIAWLGEIPAHWEVKRLKHLANIKSGVAKGRKLEGRETVELPYLRVANVQAGYVDLSDIATIEVGIDEIEQYSLQSGDVLMNEGGDYDKLGRGAVWQGEISPCLHQNHVFAVRPHNPRHASWIAAITLTSYARHFFILKSKQSTHLASISSSNLQEVPVIFPPQNERQGILNFLDTETVKLDTLIDKVGNAIECLQEYRTALISAAVTGKIDVRGEIGSRVRYNTGKPVIK